MASQRAVAEQVELALKELYLMTLRRKNRDRRLFDCRDAFTETSLELANR